jgi:hypothetical protein
MICKRCGSDNAETAKFCGQCGAKLEAEAPAFAGGRNDEPVNKKTVLIDKKPMEVSPRGFRIHECGYPLLPDMTICPHCQKPVEQGGVQTPPPAPEPAPVGQGGKKTEVIRLKDIQSPSDGGEVNKATVVIRKDNIPQSGNSEVSKATVVIRKDSLPQSGNSEVSKATTVIRKDDILQPSHDEVSKATVVIRKDSLPQAGNSEVSKATTVIRRDEIPPQIQKTGPVQSPSYEVVDKRTINPYLTKREAKPEPPAQPNCYCSLQTVDKPDSVGTSLKQEFQSPSVVLNRQNTDPVNPTITSKQQAVLTFEDGVWYIEDKSALQTTFVRVGRKTALQDGDIILMGDREFIFSTQK